MSVLLVDHCYNLCMCPAYTATPSAQLDIASRPGALKNVGEARAIQCFAAGSCSSQLWRAWPVVSQSPPEPHFPSAASLELCGNKSQTTCTDLSVPSLFLCPLLNSGYRQSPRYRKHFLHVWVLTGSKPFRSSMMVSWPLGAVSAAGAWWQQCQTMSCPAYGKAEPAANVRAFPQLWKQGSARLKMDLQTESSVSPLSQDIL